MATSRAPYAWLVIAAWGLLLPCARGESQAAANVPGLTPGIYQLAAGLWEEVDHPVTSGRVAKEYSWGEAGVVPNWGFVFELGTAEPYVQIWGESLIVKAVRVVAEGRIEMDVDDKNINGSGAFVRVLFTPATGATAMIDFERKDGSRYGASVYERKYGPAAK